MRATALIGSILLLPALCACPLAAQEARLYRLDRVTVEHAGPRVFVHVTADGVASSLAEPESLGDRTRLSLTLLRTTLGSPMPVQPLQDPALLDTRLDQCGDDVVLTLDAVAIREYGLEPREDGVVLWFEPAPAAQPAALPAPEDLAREALDAMGAIAVRAPDSAAIDAVRPGAGPERTLRAGVSDFVVGIVATARRFVDRLPIDRGPLLLALPGAGAFLMLLAIAWWLLRRRPRRMPETAQVSTGEAFAWAARTLRNEGLDVGRIAQRTGIARDAVTLLLEGMDPANPAAPGSTFRPASSRVAHGEALARPVTH